MMGYKTFGEGNAPDSGVTKSSNPKTALGGQRLDMGLVPWTVVVGVAMAFLEGALKYGRFNWRIAGVSASTYHAACQRHLAKWFNGQDRDVKTKVHHLDNAMACLAIIRDAELYGKFHDDRPPCPDPDAMARMIDEAEASVAHLKDLFKEHHPKQFTIDDTRHVPVTGCICIAPFDVKPGPHHALHCPEYRHDPRRPS